jgi:hypothetical protein
MGLNTKCQKKTKQLSTLPNKNNNKTEFDQALYIEKKNDILYVTVGSLEAGRKFFAV